MGSENDMISPVDPLAFLAHGGEMGERMRAFDWSKTPVGPAADWPQSLKTVVQILLNSRYPMFVWWGRELINIYNDAYIPVLGADHPQALGQPAPVIWTSVWPVVGPQAELVLNEGRATWNESIRLMMKRYGYCEETYFTFSYSPVPDDAGGVGGVFCACIEDTQRVLGERQLALLRDLAARTADARTWQEACDRSAAALRSDPHDLPFAMIYIAEPDGSGFSLAGASGIERGHPAVPEVVGLAEQTPWPFAALLGARDVVVIEDLRAVGGAPLPTGAWPEPPTRAALVPIAANGQTGRGGVLVVGLNPFRVFDDDYANFLTLVGGQIAASIASAQAYEEEKKRAEALAELDRAKTAFFSNISHEFRTPLTLILGPIEDMLAQNDTDVTPAIREQLEVMHRNSLRLLKLVNTMLDFSRIEAGRLQAQYEPVDLAAYTAELASVFRTAIERAGLRLIVNCPSLPEPVYVDRDMWEKIVLNLLSNAFKFTLEGEIEVRLDTSQGQACLTVRDTGTGIPAEEMSRIFERFHRVKASLGRTYEGTGIGLSLVQELVKLHGGAVRAESALNEGSRFIVSLPLGKAHLDPQRIGATLDLTPTKTGAEAFVQEALRWLPHGGSEDEQIWTRDDHVPTNGPLARLSGDVQPQGLRPRIVWAEDNADMREYVSRLLGERFEVEAVADSQAALEAVRAAPADLVLADIMMPRLDGVSLLRTLRNDGGLRDLPVILLSARAGEEARIEGMAAGADDYLIKPFSARELLARVESHVKMAWLRREASEALRQSEAQLQTLFDAAPLGIYLVDADFRIRQVNPTALAVFGDIPDLIGRDFDEVMHILWPQAYASEVVRLFRHTLETGEPYLSPERIEERRDRGVTEYYEWQLHRIPLPQGRYGVVCYFRDISPQVFARQAIAESEARWRAMFDATTVGFAILTPAARFLQINDAFCGIVGYSRDELLQLDCDALTHPDDRNMRQQQIDHLTAGDTPSCVIEQRYIRKDGALIWVQNSVSLTQNAAGQPLHLIVLCQDVTEQRQAQALAAGQKEALELAVSGASLYDVLNVLAHTAVEQAGNGARAAIFIADAAGAHLRFGATAGMSEHYKRAFDGLAIGPQSPSCGTAAYTGQTVIVGDVTHDPLWTPYLDLARAHGIRACWSVPIRAFGGNVLGTFAVYHRSPRESEPRTLEGLNLLAHTAAILIERYHAAEARTRAEEALQALNTVLEQRVIDRTAALKQAHDDLSREMRERQHMQEALFQQEKLAALGTLLANVAHELNNPLAVAALQLDNLQEEGASSGAWSEDLGTLRQAVERCQSVVQSFLALARQQAPERHAVGLNAVIGDVLVLLRRTLEVDGITIESHLPDDLPPLWADANQLQHVVANLITNAHHALRETAAPRHLRLTTATTVDQRQVILEVADSGPGIPQDVQRRIFDPFFTTKPQGVGSGLGLPLCRNIVEGHGGSIRLVSAPGHGTTVSVVLPAAVSDVQTPEASFEPGEPAQTQGGAILLIDDEPGVQRALRRLLQRSGHDITTAANGQEGLAALEARSYEVILCDMRMPDLDGPGFYRELERRYPHLLSRIIFLTGDVLGPEAQAFFAQVDSPRLEKPFKAQEVRRVIQQVLEAR